MKTGFLSLKKQHDLIDRIKNKDKKAEKEFFLELKRLEARIKQLEFKIQLLNSAFDDNSYLKP